MVYSRELSDQHLRDWGVSPGQICELDYALAHEPIRLCCWSDDTDITPVYDTLLEKYSEGIHWRLVNHGKCVFATAEGIDKLYATRLWCERNGIQQKDVVAFGDDLSDLDLLRWAGTGVAMANGHLDVIAIADEVCEPCVDAGVAKWLQGWLRK